MEEAAAVMGELIREGKIRGWGQSQASEEQVRRANAVTPYQQFRVSIPCSKNELLKKCALGIINNST